MVLTIFLALGAWRISQKRVLTRRVPAVETLGSASVLCVDKTGTLTLNQMSVRKIFAGGELFELPQSTDLLPDDLHEIVEFSILASQTDPFRSHGEGIKGSWAKEHFRKLSISMTIGHW